MELIHAPGRLVFLGDPSEWDGDVAIEVWDTNLVGGDKCACVIVLTNDEARKLAEAITRPNPLDPIVGWDGNDPIHSSDLAPNWMSHRSALA